ncbi:MAG: IclR family transcriptional regulator [Pseudomonadota bacterium]
MRSAPSNAHARKSSPRKPRAKAPPGSQTLLRGLDVIEAITDGPIALGDLAAKLGLTRSTAHRLAAALIERRYLTFAPRVGYQFGPKLLELGFLAQRQTDVVQVARPYLETLALSTGDTVHLGILDGDRALYLDKIPGRRRVEISSRVGDRHPLTSTGLGKALLLDEQIERWRQLFVLDQSTGSPPADYEVWLARMKTYAGFGHAFDLEENEDLIRCVAAPIRDASGGIVAAMSVSSAAQYMTDERMQALANEVRATAAGVSSDLGWSAKSPTKRPGRNGGRK